MEIFIVVIFAFIIALFWQCYLLNLEDNHIIDKELEDDEFSRDAFEYYRDKRNYEKWKEEIEIENRRKLKSIEYSSGILYRTYRKDDE